MSTESAAAEETGAPAHEPGAEDGAAQAAAEGADVPGARDGADETSAPERSAQDPADATDATSTDGRPAAQGEAEAASEPEHPAQDTAGGASPDEQAAEDEADGASTDGQAAAQGGADGTSTDEQAAAQGGADGASTDGQATEDEADGTSTDEQAAAQGGADVVSTDEQTTTGDAGAAGEQVSEAEAELAAQRELRERIERRKAEKEGPVASGTKLSGKAADLLAAVRAVESGEKPASRVFDAAEPASRRPAPEQARRPQPPAPVRTPAEPAAETVGTVRAVLAEGGAPGALAEPAAAALGDGADTLLREDPWRLLRVPGVRPEQADGFARALLGDACGPDDERRSRAVAVWLLEQAAVAGHTALDATTLESALGRYAVSDPDAAVQSAISEGDLLVFQDALDSQAPGAAAPAPVAPASGAESEGDEQDEEEQPVRVLVGLERCALAEESLADGLARVVNSLVKEESQERSELLSAADAAKGSTAELIRAVAGHSLVLHTGGEAARAEPAALVAAAASAGLRVCAAAHTAYGRRVFARSLAAASPQEAPEAADTAPAVVTVHGLLSGAEGPGRDSEGALALDLLVVLDAPQLDVETAAMLVESLPDGARLLLSGDPGVLWSAGAGRVFADVLAARGCPVVVSRTPDEGPIGELVSGIGIGELNQVAAPGKEVVIVPVRDAGEAVHRTVQLVADSVPRAFQLPADATQVITVGHGGAAGTRALNAALKERLNPGPGRFGGFDPGDRVAYATAGSGRTRLGRVVRADAEGLHLECEGDPVVVPKDRVEQSVRHGWALTAQQAAGQRWPAAVAVLPGDAAQGLTRAWVYTAFSRGERHLSVVHGVEQALPRAVAEVPAKPRTTRLQTLLRAQLPSADQPRT
ncbi:helix-hairpin-helix domain-containing protein [Streptomyces monticola]|uniref:Helix-hairpin-helix domain-containing protein n=1 Tax=Streptomyces monticola TaxID=2666263 RepID=A0ABW2JKX5_9ACTN